jgi:uncharacterized membrane protein
MPKQSSEVAHPEKDDRVLYIFAYLLMWISGLIMFLTVGQTNKRMKFHAVQSVLVGIVVFVLIIIPLPLIPLIGILIWIYGLYVGFMAFEGRDLSMPGIGDYAEKYSK